jgi:hypothetical protein
MFALLRLGRETSLRASRSRIGYRHGLSLAGRAVE